MKYNGMLFVLIVVFLLSGCVFDIDSTTSTTVQVSNEEKTSEPITSTEETSDEIPNDDLPNYVPEDEIPIGWKLIWNDEFNYEGKPDPTKWGYDIGGHGWGNRELQYYTDRIDNAYVSNGYLTITARKEQMFQNAYTSARLVSKNKGDFQYGRIEVRAKVPKEKGTWSAIWMLPTDWFYGGWPNSGEIDIMEHVGYDPVRIHGTIHTGKYNHMNGTQKGKSYYLPEATTEFHTYAIEWYPREIVFFVDDQPYYITRFDEIKDRGSADYLAWPFNQRFHIIMNIAVGGNWGGQQGIDPNWEEAEMVIDYVRVYQRDFAHNDIEAPTKPTFEDAIITQSSLDLLWHPSTDNLYVKEYVIYLNDQLYGTSFSARYLLNDLEPNTKYNVKVYAVDFANNRSEPLEYTFTTLNMPKIPGKIEGENYVTISGDATQTLRLSDREVLGKLYKNDSVTYGFYVSEPGKYRLTLHASSNGPEFVIAVYTVDQHGNHLMNYGRNTFRGGNINQYQTYTLSGEIDLSEGIQYITLYNRSTYRHYEVRIDWIILEKMK